MVDMSTSFEESAHPRATTGQFREKTNSAPTAELAGSDRAAHLQDAATAFEHAVWASKLEAIQWRKRIHEQTVELLMAQTALHAPPNTAAAVFRANHSGDGVELVYFEDVNGEEVDGGFLDDHFELEDASLYDLRDLGFEDVYVDGELSVSRLPLRAPVIPARPIVPNAGNYVTDADDVDRQCGSDGGLASFLGAIARRHEGAGVALLDLSIEQRASVNRDFEAYTAMVAKRIADYQTETLRSL